MTSLFWIVAGGLNAGIDWVRGRKYRRKNRTDIVGRVAVAKIK